MPEARRQDIRELLVGNYRLIYRAAPDRIEILAVVHGRRDLSGDPKLWAR